MMMRLAVMIACVVLTAAWEPEEEAYFNKRGLQSHSSAGHSSGGHSSGGHSSGGHSSGGHSSGGRRARPPDETKTGCTPKKGGDLPKTTSSTPDAVNEPCYVHDAACEGYPVCCVKKGTCIDKHGGMVSSNAAYYEGGCVSPASSAKELPEGCAKQGECHAMYLEHMKGGTTAAGLANDVSPYVVETLMTGAEGCEAFWSPPIPIWGYVLIGVGALVVLIIVIVVIKMVACKKKSPAKGAPTSAEVAA